MDKRHRQERKGPKQNEKKGEKTTGTVANPRNSGVEDIDSLKKEAVELMALSVGQEQEHVCLGAKADMLKTELVEVQSRCGQARDSAAVLRLRAGGKFRQVRDLLKPTKGGWTRWMDEVAESRDWKPTMVREAIELHELAGGDESKVKGQRISHALQWLRGSREQEERAAEARRAAENRWRDKERLEAEAARRYDSAEAARRLGEARAWLSQVFGGRFDPEALSPQDVESLAAMVPAEPSPGLSGLMRAWHEATPREREAFDLWIKGGGR